jgi:hypothetical protein
MIDVLGDLIRKRPAIKVEKEAPPKVENAVGHTNYGHSTGHRAVYPDTIGGRLIQHGAANASAASSHDCCGMNLSESPSCSI